MEIIGLLAGLAIVGILLFIFFSLIGLVKWLLQGYFLFRVAEKKNLDIPLLGFVPFGTFYLGGQMYDGHVLDRGRFNPKTIGAAFAIIGIVVYLMGLSIGDIAITYVLMESIAFFGIFKAYTKNFGTAALLSVLNMITVGIAAIIILFLYNRKLEEDAMGIVDESSMNEEQYKSI